MPLAARLRFAALGIALTLLAVASTPMLGVAGAAPATPAATDAAGCTIEPRRFDDIADLASTPTASVTPIPAGGTPADAATVSAVTETIRMAVACANANDPLRAFALFTDRYLAERFGPAHPDDLGSLFAALSREPVPADQADLLSLVEVRDVTLLADDLVAATVVTENRATRYVDRLVFRLAGDRWLIDRWAPLEDVATPAA
jgi:hypothetical protein